METPYCRHCGKSTWFEKKSEDNWCTSCADDREARLEKKSEDDKVKEASDDQSS